MHEGGAGKRFVVKLKIDQVVGQGAGRFLGNQDGVFSVSGGQKGRLQYVHGLRGHGSGFCRGRTGGRKGHKQDVFKAKKLPRKRPIFTLFDMLKTLVKSWVFSGFSVVAFLGWPFLFGSAFYRSKSQSIRASPSRCLWRRHGPFFPP